jgi:hypothetical protein
VLPPQFFAPGVFAETRKRPTAIDTAGHLPREPERQLHAVSLVLRLGYHVE